MLCVFNLMVKYTAWYRAKLSGNLCERAVLLGDQMAMALGCVPRAPTSWESSTGCLGFAGSLGAGPEQAQGCCHGWKRGWEGRCEEGERQNAAKLLHDSSQPVDFRDRQQRMRPGEEHGGAEFWGLNLDPRERTSIRTHHMCSQVLLLQPSVYGRDGTNEDRCCTWRDVCSCFH